MKNQFLNAWKVLRWLLTRAFIFYRGWDETNGFFLDDTELWLASEIPVPADTPESFTAIAVSGTQINVGWLDGANNADSFSKSVDGVRGYMNQPPCG